MSLKVFKRQPLLNLEEQSNFHLLYRDKYAQNVRLACALGFLAFLVFAGVDPFLVSGEELFRVWTARVAIGLVIAVLYGLSFVSRVCEIPNLLVVMTSLAIGWGVVVVTLLTGGGNSNYHEALLLTMIGYSSIIVWSPLVAACTFTAIVAMYDLVLCLGQAMGTAAHFASNNAVLWSGVVIGVSGVAVSQRLREIDFLRGRELSRSNERLLEMDAAKNAFFANVSHELRTPLMMIIAAIDSVQEQNLGDLKIGQQVQVGRRNGLRLLRLVDDLLELSKLESDTIKLRYSSFSLGSFVEELAAQTRALAERKGISVAIDVAACGDILADHHQVERVVLNLLANAIKFTGVGGMVTAALRPEGEGVRVEISDTGEGIAPEALPRIFERFYQANQSSKAKRGGVGIGLSLSKRIVELHGGHIEARSVVGAGTTVGFWLPLGGQAAAVAAAGSAVGTALRATRAAAAEGHGEGELAAAVPAVGADGVGGAADGLGAPGLLGSPGAVDADGMAPRQPPPAAEVVGEKGMPEWDQALRERADYRFFGIQEVADRRAMPRSEVKNDGPSVLVVDDNRDMVDFMISILGADHQVWAAADGEEGLRLARRHRPELIVSDLVMPNMSGLEFLREVRADPHLATLPFVLLTARGLEGDRRESDQARADAFLPKPFFAGDLRPIVSRLLHKQGGQASELQDANVLAMRMMAAGIAHDILNPVGFVRHSLDIVRENFLQAIAWGDPKVHPVEEVRGYGEDFLRSAGEGVERVIAAVGELRRFARGEVTGELQPVDVGDCVGRIISLTRPHGVFDTALKATQRPRVRHGQLEQVLLNLVLNALQAGGNNCKISIASHDDLAQERVIITVRDGGPGMDATTLAKIFDPYFTTKKTGTGLGLTMCRQIVRDHGGRLDVDSQPGQGTSFVIALPFQAGPSEAAHVEP